MTITIDYPMVENKYSQYEIQVKFLEFLEKEMNDEKIELFEITFENLPKITQNRFDNIDKLNFCDY